MIAYKLYIKIKDRVESRPLYKELIPSYPLKSF